MSECSATITGKHAWSYRKRQLQARDGSRFHPTVKESWMTFIGCVCGLEAPHELEADIRRQWRETKQAGSWRGETGTQGELL